MILLRLLGVALALTAAACRGDEGVEGDPLTDTTEVGAPTVRPSSGTTGGSALTDPQIVGIAAAANTVDIQASEAARSRAQNAEVRALAEQMVTDHTAANRQATELASRLGVTPEETDASRQLLSSGQQAMQRLDAATGAEFDRAYLANEVSFHQTVLETIDRQLIPSAQNAELKTLLQTVRATVDMHLQRAQQTQRNLGASTA